MSLRMSDVVPQLAETSECGLRDYMSIHPQRVLTVFNPVTCVY